MSRGFRDQLHDAAASTSRAYTTAQLTNRDCSTDDTSPDAAAAAAPGGGEGAAEEVGSAAKETKMAAEVAVMQPILRFLQLLCENHYSDMQASVTVPIRLQSIGLATAATLLGLKTDKYN